jgi:hypothetical protein
VTQQLLDGANVVPGLKQVGGEAVAQGMGGGVLADLGGGDGAGDGALENGFVDVMATLLAGHGIDVVAAGGKQPLPGPGSAGAGILAVEGVGQGDTAGAGVEVALVPVADLLQMRAQGGVTPFGRC